MDYNKPKQSCDNCRRRKIKCSRESPCDKCQRLCLECSYGDVLSRKGPKFRTYYPLARGHPLWQQQPRPLSDIANGTATAHDGYTVLPLPNPAAQGQHQPELDNTRPYARRLTPSILLAHVNIFLKYLFPIMPVVRRDELRQDSHQPRHVSAQRYAFLAALCATTHIQLKLDGASQASAMSGIDGQALMSGDELLAEAVRARNECDIIEQLNTETLMTSFFLFASYGNLDKQAQAWFYLSQTISMAFTLGLHSEATYTTLPIEEAEEKRRIFWLLFVTERGYALQQSKPIMLRPSIQKPQVLCSNDPILAYGFLNLIALFEKLTVDLYDWLSTGGSPDANTGMDQVSSTASSIQARLCNAPIASLHGIMEIQQVDILVTQQWLQTMMWRVSLAASPSSKDRNLPFHLPVIIGRAVMGIISAASQAAVDAHGIGMEQKLYDLGSSIAKVASTSPVPRTKPCSQSPSRSLSRSLSQTQAQAQTSINEETLWSILKTLSRIRGSQSHLLPRLLEHCTPVLRLDGALTISDYLPVLGAENHSPSHQGHRHGPGVGVGVGSVGAGLSPDDLSSENTPVLVRHESVRDSVQDSGRVDSARVACGWAGYSC